MRILLVVVCAGAAAAAPWTRAEPPPPAAQTVDVAAERFSFSPSEIKTPAGTALTIRLTSDDTAHGFRILGTDVNVEIPKRSRGVIVSFTPAKAGRYTFECSKLCGAGHAFMRGVIVATNRRGTPMTARPQAGGPAPPLAPARCSGPRALAAGQRGSPNRASRCRAHAA